MIKHKKWLAIGGVVMAALLLIGIVSSAFPKKESCKHVWSDYTIAVAATCGSNGRKVKTCTECGAVENVVIKATGSHTWTDGECETCNLVLSELSTSIVKAGDKASGWYRTGIDLGEIYSLTFAFSVFNVSEDILDFSNAHLFYDAVGYDTLDFSYLGIVSSPGYATLTPRIQFSCFRADEFLYFYVPDSYAASMNLDRFVGDTYSSVTWTGTLTGFTFRTVSGVEKVHT